MRWQRIPGHRAGLLAVGSGILLNELLQLLVNSTSHTSLRPDRREPPHMSWSMKVWISIMSFTLMDWNSQNARVHVRNDGTTA